MPWGIPLGKGVQDTVNNFQFVGTADKIMWERSGPADRVHLRFICTAVNACFSIPARGDFVFLDGKLAEASLSIQREQSPAKINAATHMIGLKAKYGMTKASAVVSVVGRRSEYHLFDGYTVVWVQDGADAQVKLYLDKLSPIGRAEAVAAGAASKLEHLPGAKRFAKAHKAIVDGQWGAATQAFELLLTDERQASPLLLEQGRFLLAMAIAAELKASARQGRLGDKKIISELDRARKLAPGLKTNLDELQEELTGPGKSPF